MWLFIFSTISQGKKPTFFFVLGSALRAEFPVSQCNHLSIDYYTAAALTTTPGAPFLLVLFPIFFSPGFLLWLDSRPGQAFGGACDLGQQGRDSSTAALATPQKFHPFFHFCFNLCFPLLSPCRRLPFGSIRDPVDRLVVHVVWANMAEIALQQHSPHPRSSIRSFTFVSIFISPRFLLADVSPSARFATRWSVWWCTPSGPTLPRCWSRRTRFATTWTRWRRRSGRWG